MSTSIITSLLSVAGVLVGCLIGFVFGTLQNAALARNKKRQEKGEFKAGVAIMPGSFGRVALLLIVLMVVQIVCPMLFEGNIQWLVSVGVILGYGWTLLRQLRQHSVDHA
jgi:Ca2+/H+ antiporter